MHQYELPVCNSFKSKILNDQLCYEVDLQKYKSKGNIKNDLKSGLVFFLDYNEDRQITSCDKFEADLHQNFVNKVDKSMDDEKAFIYLNTIGKYFWLREQPNKS